MSGNLSTYAFIPQRLSDQNYPELVGFPLNIFFAHPQEVSKDALINECFWPSPATLKETEEEKSLDYFNKAGDGFWVRVFFIKKNGHWRTEKYKVGKLIRISEAADFKTAMIHTTMWWDNED